MMVSRPARHACLATEHGVTGDPLANPIRRYPGPDLAHCAGPLVPRSKRILRMTGVEVCHVAGPKFLIRAAHAHEVDVDHDLAGFGFGLGRFLYLGPPGRGDRAFTAPQFA